MDVVERDAIEDLLHGRLHGCPHIAQMGSRSEVRGILWRAAAQLGKWSIESTHYLSHGYGPRWAGQLVAASSPSLADDDARPPELRQDGAQEPGGQLLGGGQGLTCDPSRAGFR